MDKRMFFKAATGMLLLNSLPAFAQSSGGQKFSLSGVDNQSRRVQLADYAGRLCLVSFFTAGCNLCNHDLKLMREFYAGNKARGFTLLGVNLDANKADFTDYVRLINLTTPAEQSFPMIWRNNPGHVDTFGPITRQPTHFVLDKSQQLIFRREGTFQPDDWDTLWTKLS